MLNENENMDELFRKAAEDYPLRLEPKDWNKIAAAYVDVPVAARFAPKKRYFIALALLLFTGIAGLFIVNNNREATNIGLQSNSQKNVQENNHDENITGDDEFFNGQKKVSDFDLPSAPNSSVKNLAPKQPPQRISKVPVSNHPVIFTPFNNTIPTTSVKASLNKGITKPQQKEKFPALLATNKSVKVFATTEDVEINEVKMPASEKLENIELNSETESVTSTTAIASKDNKQQKQNDKKRFYFGLTSSLNFSTIRQQPTVSPMFGIGALAGVSFNQFISLETGIQISSHKYFSTGNYFKPKPGVMPANMKVEEMVGKVNTIDIPVSLKYNLVPLHKNLFVTSGFSNTIITDEHNIYDVTVNGQPMSKIGDYGKTKFFPISSINFSVGYQNQIGKNFRVQAEPYIQIPLRGTGVGYMPVTNFGLRFAFLKAK